MHDLLSQDGVSKKGKNIYYLLPGQGHGARRRWLRNIIVAIVVGVSLSGLMWWFWWLLSS
jgi:hypothetical protein